MLKQKLDIVTETMSSSEESENDAMEQEEEESEANSAESEGDDDVLAKNEGWADAIQKILATKKPKNKKTLVLSRAKKHGDVKPVKEEISFELVKGPEVKDEIKDEPVEVKTDPDTTTKLVKKRKTERPSIRKKPEVLERNREKTLAKIATRGVVQLFNAVKNQQKSLKNETDGKNTEAKRDKILKSFDKKAFLDTLMGDTKSVIVDQPKKDESGWSALRDDFMLDATLKDWDKKNNE